MAIQRTKPGQSFLNRPIGVVSQRTGAEKVYEARAREAEQIGQFAFEYAVSTQKKEGIEYGKEVEVRDENGNLSVQQMPASLGKYGRAEAEKIFAERFLTAAKVDASKVFNKLHMAYSNDPVGFERASTEYMKQTALQMEAEGAGNLARIWHDNAYATAMQHTNKIALDKFNLDNDIAVSNYIDSVEADTGEMTSAFSSGDFDKANLIHTDLLASIDNQFKTSQINDTQRRDLRNSVNDNRLISVVRARTQGNTSQQNERLIANASRRDFDSIDKDYPGLGDEFKRFAFNQTRLNRFRIDFGGVIDKIKKDEKNNSDLRAGEAIVNTRQPIDVYSEKNQKDTDMYFRSKYGASGIDFANPLFLQSKAGQSFLQDLANTQVYPKSLITVFEDFVTGNSGLEYTDNQHSALLSMFRQSMPEGSAATKGLSQKTLFRLNALEHLDEYSPASKELNLNSIRLIYNNNPETLERIKSETGKKGTTVFNVVSNFIRDEIAPQPEHLNDLAIVSASLFLSNPDQAKTITEDYYNKFFIESDFLKPVAGNPGRSLHAPEAFFDREGLVAFEAFVQNKLLTTDALTFDDKGRPVVPVFKKDIFLEVDVGSTDITRYFLVDRDGNRVRNPQTGNVVFVGPKQIGAYRQKVAAINRAEFMSIRDQRIAQAEQAKPRVFTDPAMMRGVGQ